MTKCGPNALAFLLWYVLDIFGQHVNIIDKNLYKIAILWLEFEEFYSVFTKRTEKRQNTSVTACHFKYENVFDDVKRI